MNIKPGDYLIPTLTNYSYCMKVKRVAESYKKGYIRVSAVRCDIDVNRKPLSATTYTEDHYDFKNSDEKELDPEQPWNAALKFTIYRKGQLKLDIL